MPGWSARKPPFSGGTVPALVAVLLAMLALLAPLTPLTMAGPARAAPPAATEGPSGGSEGYDRRGLELDSARADDNAFTVDGHLDEPAWTAIVPMPELIQQGPAFGAPATHATRIRAAYTSAGLYFSFECDEPHGKVIAPFFQRDQIVASDYVQVEIDSNDDNTNGYVFGVSPSGAIFDGQLFRDTDRELLWDGVWQSAAARTPTGWSAEIFVPWTTLRFERKPEQRIGLNFTRSVNDNQEFDRLSFVPQGVPAGVSEGVSWTGITGIEAGLNLELQPYVSGRFVLQRPSASLDQSWRALPNTGFDLKYGITGDLTLDLAVNPDFGQAEVDAAVLNLGPFEVFFPEKRRFFLESKEIFETPFPLFYSRRVGAAPNPGSAQTTTRQVYGEQEQGELIGLEPLSRVLGSVRLTGQIAPGWVLGVLTAATGPTWGRQRFSDGLEQRVPVDPFAAWSVLRLRRHFDPQTWVGGIVTNVARLGDAPGATTGGFDYNINFRENWVHGAQVIATHDGERSGMGGNFNLLRTGKRTLWGVASDFLTPHANFSDLGFMTRNNYAAASTQFMVFNAQPIGKVRGISGRVQVRAATSFSGEITEKQLMTNWALETRGLWQFSAFAGGHLPQLDLFETRGNIPYEVPLHWWMGGRISTPRNKRVSTSVGANYGEQDGNPGPDVFVDLALRPVDRLQVSLSGSWNASWNRPRWVAERESDAVPIFGRGRLTSTNVVLRLTLALTPTLSLTSYNQLLYSVAHHTEFLELDAPDLLAPIPLEPWYGSVDRALTNLTSNSILRWEYLPGSFLFVAYTHRSSLPQGEGVIQYRVDNAFTNLVAEGAQHEDVLFIKLAYLFGL